MVYLKIPLKGVMKVSPSFSKKSQINSYHMCNNAAAVLVDNEMLPHQSRKFRQKLSMLVNVKIRTNV